MSKGSKQRPMQISESQMQSNWDLIFSKKDELIEIYVWADGTWCEKDELEEMSHMSDDYRIEALSYIEYEDLLEGKLVL